MDERKLPATGSCEREERLREFISEDREKAIRHEVGHLTVALALGCPGEVEIMPNRTDKPMYEKTWVGKFSFATLFQPRNNRERTMIALAGWLAELLHEDPDADLWAELCGFFDEGLSESDLGMVTLNNQWIVKWAEEVWALLQKFAAFREWAAARLAENEYISAEEAIEAFPAKRKLARYNALNKKMQKLAEEAMKRFEEGSGGTTP